MNKVLGIDDFFYVTDDSYDDLAEKALPHYHEAHHLLVASLNFPRNAALDIVDLGVGTGVTSAYFLKNFPHAHITGVDLFNEMIEEARMRLSPFADRVTLVQSDNTTFLRSLDRKVDAIVSAFCIHHLDEAGKKQLFSCIHDCLHSGGQFLMLDLTTFINPHLKQLARDATLMHMSSQVNTHENQQKWARHWSEKNQPSAADEMITWLRSVGFRAETVSRWLEVALIAASIGEDAS